MDCFGRRYCSRQFYPLASSELGFDDRTHGSGHVNEGEVFTSILYTAHVLDSEFTKEYKYALHFFRA